MTCTMDRRRFVGLLTLLGQSRPMPAEDQVFRRTPSLHDMTFESVVILWAMPVRAKCVIEVSQAGDALPLTFPVEVFDEATAVYRYRANVRGLAPSTTYQYRIVAGDAPLKNPVSRPLEFRTAPVNGGTAFRFLHFADSGDGGDAQLRVCWEMQKEEGLSFVLANGDLAYDLATAESVEQHYFGVYRDLMATLPFFATLGNHEYYTEAGKPSLQMRVSPRAEGVPVADEGRYYSFDWGNVHFVALDSNWPLEEAAAGRGGMLRWLENDLRRTRKFWRIAYFHHPGYATGKHEFSVEAARVREYIVPILERYGVQIAFHGHEHTYQRTYELLAGEVVPAGSGGIVYITSGGGGAGTYWTEPNARIAAYHGINHYVRVEVAGPKLDLHVRGLREEQDLDALTLAPPPLLTGEVMGGGGLSTNLASGGLAWISGRNLSAVTLPVYGEESNGLSVRVGDFPATIVSADGGQICVQLPREFQGEGKLEVSTANGKAILQLTVQAVAPSLLPNPRDPASAWVRHADGSPVDALRPAAPFETVTVLCTGLGAVRDRKVMVPVQLRVGAVTVTADEALLSATSPGVYEVRFTVPEFAEGEWTGRSLQVRAGGIASNRLLLY